MLSIAVIGAGITGVTTAYELSLKGFSVTVYDRHRFAAMETSFANGGQLSASNAEVWTHPSTIAKGLRWLLRDDAPLSLSLRPSWHKYSWLAEFLGNMGSYRSNTTQTARLAVAARQRMRDIAEAEKIQFDRDDNGILHFYTTEKQMDHARRVSELLAQGGVERLELDAVGIRRLEPRLKGQFVGGFHTPGDATGDIHLFTTGLADASKRRGVAFIHEADILSCESSSGKISITYRDADGAKRSAQHSGVVVCAGIGSRQIARQLGDRINIYPVKGYSITVNLLDDLSRDAAPKLSLLDDAAKVVTSRLGSGRFRVAGTAEFSGANRDIRACRIEPLIKWVNRHFPDVSTRQSVPWAGLRPMTPSMMPRVGPGRRENVFYNTGHGHLGWTLSAATAELVASSVSENWKQHGRGFPTAAAWA
ncbi:D-amino acid dehydrogenase [Rhizobium sp. BT-175]|uniref:D-amino acid dehydrogenase n=1 Tax=Rhizobium sp. BT-175 TaxID=2986929 RepID=UPI00223653AB|nr:D-amino acid dehydrogenase [Rhizobium sp. BT-175]MCV9947662.1 D-amino acid dehydrogenase [Rhizobium sp. BT-175]